MNKPFKAIDWLLARLVISLIIWPIILCKGLSPLWLNRRRRHDNKTLLMIGSFYNKGWFQAHAVPLLRSGHVDRILVLCDDPYETDIDNITFVCPTPRMRRLLGRELGRLAMLFRISHRHRPMYYMGYHIMPNAPMGLLGASLFGGHAVYQMTGGPKQIHGGGFGVSENPLLRKVQTRSAYLQWLLFWVVKNCASLVVRGSTAANYSAVRDLNSNIEIVTGAIDTNRYARSDQTPEYDGVFVGRLVNVKGVDRIIDMLALMKERGRTPRVLIIGDGPHRAEFERYAQSNGVADQLEFAGSHANVLPHLHNGRVFLLPSRNEGVSIAMMEAMSCGLPVVASEIGDLADLVPEHRAGVLVPEFEARAAADAFTAFLENDVLYKDASFAAREQILRHHSVDAIAAKWSSVLGAMHPAESQQSSQCT